MKYIGKSSNVQTVFSRFLLNSAACLASILFTIPTLADDASINFDSSLSGSSQFSVSVPATLQGIAKNDFNPYDDAQLEELVLAAREHQEAGAHAVALELFDQAWQVSRVTNGLYHEAQVPLLEDMIASRIELEDWEGMDANYAYMELIYNRLYELTDPRLELGLQQISSWHVNAFNANLDGRKEQHLRKARLVLKQRLEIAHLTLPKDDPKFAFLNESIFLCEQHLFLMSERHKMLVQKQQRTARDSLLATLD